MPSPAKPAEIALAAALAYAQGADAPETRRAYATDWRDFTAWCAKTGLDPLPAAPETIAAFLAAAAPRLALATLRRRLAAIARAHRQASISYDGDIRPVYRVGTGLHMYPVPNDETYSYVYVNDHPVLIENKTGTVVWVGE